MDKSSRYCLLFPGEEKWESWRQAAPGEEAAFSRHLERDELAFEGSDVRRVLALPASCAYAMPQWIFAKDDGELRNAVELNLEKEGLLRPGEPAGFDFERIEEKDGRQLVRADALAKCDLALRETSPAPDLLCLSPRLLPLPDGRIVIWRELGRFVAAVTRKGKLVYHNMITASRIDAKAIDEILRWSKQFTFQGMLEPVQGITLWTELADLEAVQSRSGLPVAQEPRPAPRFDEGAATRIIPEFVHELRQKEIQRTRTKRLIWAGVWSGCLIVLAFGILTILAMQQRRDLLDRITELSPSASAIQRIQQRWNEVAPAVEADASPLETMLLIHGLPSAQEISLTRFELSSERLSLQGRATSPSEALRFLGAISKSEQLAQFRWTYPQPLIAQDGTASFEIEGVINTESAAE